MTATFLLLSAIVAGPCDEQNQRVQVTVIAILATEKNDKVDPKLECIAKEVQKKEPNLTGFQLAQTSKESLTVGKPGKFCLIEKEEAEIIVRHGANKENRVCLKVKAPQMGEFTYSSACGKFFPIITRYHTMNQERLIIAIMVKPCRSEK